MINKEKIWKDRPRNNGYVRLHYIQGKSTLPREIEMQLFSDTTPGAHTKAVLASLRSAKHDLNIYEDIAKDKDDEVYYCVDCTKYIVINISNVGYKLEELQVCPYCKDKLEYIPIVLQHNWNTGVPYFGKGISNVGTHGEPSLDDREITHPEEYVPIWDRDDIDHEFLAKNSDNIKSI